MELATIIISVIAIVGLIEIAAWIFILVQYPESFDLYDRNRKRS